MMMFMFSYLKLILLIGLVGLWFNSENLILLLVSLEMILLTILMLFCLSSLILNSISGMMMGLLMTVMSATELSLGLMMMILLYKLSGSMQNKNLVNLSNKCQFYLQSPQKL